MKKTTLFLALVLVIVLGLTCVVSALPYNCPNCSQHAGYDFKEATYRYQLTSTRICRHGEAHMDNQYHLWKYRYNVCSWCGYELPSKYYFETNVVLCPGEPIPDLLFNPEL